MSISTKARYRYAAQKHTQKIVPACHCMLGKQVQLSLPWSCCTAPGQSLRSRLCWQLPSTPFRITSLLFHRLFMSTTGGYLLQPQNVCWSSGRGPTAFFLLASCLVRSVIPCSQLLVLLQVHFLSPLPERNNSRREDKPTDNCSDSWHKLAA